VTALAAQQTGSKGGVPSALPPPPAPSVAPNSTSGDYGRSTPPEPLDIPTDRYRLIRVPAECNGCTVFKGEEVWQSDGTKLMRGLLRTAAGNPVIVVFPKDAPAGVRSDIMTQLYEKEVGFFEQLAGHMQRQAGSAKTGERAKRASEARALLAGIREQNQELQAEASEYLNRDLDDVPSLLFTCTASCQRMLTLAHEAKLWPGH
jgi:hypothetical protein